MSQDEFGNSPEISLPSAPPEHSEHDSQSFYQKLHECTEKCEQAHVLLLEAQTRLDLAQHVIQQQEELTQSLNERIAQLETELIDKSEQLIQSMADCEDLRSRLKRQQHHNSQLKAALERCLDVSTQVDNKEESTSTETWSVAKLAEEQITNLYNLNTLINLAETSEAPIRSVLEDVVKITPAIQVTSEPVVTSDHETMVEEKSNHAAMWDATNLEPEFIEPIDTVKAPLTPQADLLTANTIDPDKHRNQFNQSSYIQNLVLPQVATPQFIQALSDKPVPASEASPSLSYSRRKSVTSFAAVKLPQFPPLSRR